MGLLGRKKSVTPPAPPEETKLAKMPTEDIYLLMETSLMEAQNYLSKFRGSDEETRGALIAWVQSGVAIMDIGCKELSRRI
jgi:hypothetical protein